MKVAVVILNFNGERFLKQFLPGVIASCDPAIAEVVVADNASTDNSVALMRESFPLVRLIENGSNGGFATGYNVALKQIEAQYFVLLNSDIEVGAGWIEPVVELIWAERIKTVVDAHIFPAAQMDIKLKIVMAVELRDFKGFAEVVGP